MQIPTVIILLDLSSDILITTVLLKGHMGFLLFLSTCELPTCDLRLATCDLRLATCDLRLGNEARELVE